MLTPMRAAPLAALFLSLMLGLMIIAAPVHAQERRRVTRTPSELLAAYVRDKQTPGAFSSATVDITYILMDRADYPAANREAFLQGLENLALTASSPDLRGEAAFSFALAGSRRSTRPLPGMYARLERLYDRSPATRGAIVAAMAELADSEPALAFLERIAVQDPTKADFPGSASDAIAALGARGQAGRAVLQRLHETDAVRDPQAKYLLSQRASHGYHIKTTP